MAKSNVTQIQTARDRFRAKTLGASSTRRTETITLDIDGEPYTIVIKAPSLSGQEAAQDACGMASALDQNGNAQTQIAHPLRYSIEMVILCCFEAVYGPNGEVTGPGQPIFTATDRDALMQEAVSGWLKQLTEAVSKFNKEKPAEAAKNSEATPAASSASL